ncbi:hypothetical protein [Streptomyces sp. NPDC057877]|uniref:hypothetical protein n=1 Tax=Streptomyces sp. NPDC057877 TaxID=3346269 RepID=UPI0036CEEE84
MTDSTPERPDTTTQHLSSPPPPAAPPYAYPATVTVPPPPAPPSRTGIRALVVTVVVVLLLAGGGTAWWALARDDGGDGGGAIDHVELSGGKLVNDDSAYGEDCDDTDAFSYNDCDTYGSSDTDATYEFEYEITNKGSGYANYSVIVNAFDEDGDFIGQTYIGATHLAAGKTDSDEGEFGEYDTFEDGRDASDIDSVEVAHVERRSLVN